METAVPGEREEVVAQSTEKGQSLSPAAVEAEKTASVQPSGEEAPVQETSAIAVEQVVPEEVKVEASGALQPELPKVSSGEQLHCLQLQRAEAWVYRKAGAPLPQWCTEYVNT